MDKASSNAFLAFAGELIEMYRRDDTDADRRSEAVVWRAIRLVLGSGSLVDASVLLRESAKFSRGVERLNWLALAGFLDERARLLGRA